MLGPAIFQFVPRMPLSSSSSSSLLRRTSKFNVAPPQSSAAIHTHLRRYHSASSLSPRRRTSPRPPPPPSSTCQPPTQLKYAPLSGLARSNMSSGTTTTATHPASTPPDVSSTQPSAPGSGANHVAAPRAGPDDAAARHPHPAAAGDAGEDGDGRTEGEASAAAPLPPALPAPGEVGNDATTTTTLEIDGKAVALDHLGPMVVGRDGTVSRIANWSEMADIERENTLRILTKRNQVRLAALRGTDKTGA